MTVAAALKSHSLSEVDGVFRQECFLGDFEVSRFQSPDVIRDEQEQRNKQHKYCGLISLRTQFGWLDYSLTCLLLTAK